MLFIGAFTPIISIPIIGYVNYFQNGRGDGILIIGFALSSLVLTLTEMYEWLWLTGIASLAVMAFTFINFHLRIRELKSGMESQLAGNPFRGLADMAISSVQIQWGWALLIVGAGLIIAAAAIKE